MGAGPYDNLENGSQAKDQSSDSSLSSALWQELGSQLTKYLAPEKANANGAHESLDFSTGDIYSTKAPAKVTDQAPATADPHQFSPEDMYRGEIILRDIAPENYVTSKEESLADIAKNHIGPKASKKEIEAHIKETARINYMDVDDKIPAEYQVILPGHTRDGGFSTLDHADNKKTVWADGRELVERHDGSGYERKSVSDNSYSETRWGPEPEDNYEVVRTADGKYLVADASDPTPHEVTDHQHVGAERARLSDLAESISDDPSKINEFRQYMEKFEKRAGSEKLAQEDVAKTYHQLSRLIEGQGTPVLDAEHRKALARQIIEQAADPTCIDQGSHNTCNVATVETRMYTRDPAHAVKFVTDMAMTGQFTTDDGSVIQVDHESLKPHTQSSLEGREDGLRSYASQVFQVAAVNVYWQRQSDDGKGNEIDVRYEQVDPEGDSDNGERLRDYWSGSPVELTEGEANELSRHPQISIDGIQDIYQEISGDADKAAFLAHERTSGEVPKFSDAEELRNHLIDLKNNDQLPAVIKVDANNEPFLTDSNGGTEGGSDGWHVVTVTDIDPETGRVSIDNQWGMDSDKLGADAIPVEELYLSTWKSTANSHRAEVADYTDDLLKQGADVQFTELDSLRLDHDAELTNLKPLEKWIKANPESLYSGIAKLGLAVARFDADERYDTALAEKIVEIEKRSDVKESQDSIGDTGSWKVDEKLKDMVEAMSEERQARLAEKVKAGLEGWTHTAPVDPVTIAAERHWWWDELQ